MLQTFDFLAGELSFWIPEPARFHMLELLELSSDFVAPTRILKVSGTYRLCMTNGPDWLELSSSHEPLLLYDCVCLLP